MTKTFMDIRPGRIHQDPTPEGNALPAVATGRCNTGTLVVPRDKAMSLISSGDTMGSGLARSLTHTHEIKESLIDEVLSELSRAKGDVREDELA